VKETDIRLTLIDVFANLFHTGKILFLTVKFRR